MGLLRVRLAIFGILGISGIFGIFLIFLIFGMFWIFGILIVVVVGINCGSRDKRWVGTRAWERWVKNVTEED